MGRRNKIMDSPYFQDIHEKLASGEKPKNVAEWYNNLKDIPEPIASRTFSRYYAKYIKQTDKVKAKYNQRKAEEKAKKRDEEEKETKLQIEKTTDEFTDSLVNDLEIIDSNILKVSQTLDISQMTPGQQGQFLINLIKTKASITGVDGDSDLDFNIFDFFTDDDEDILNDVRNSNE